MRDPIELRLGTNPILETELPTFGELAARYLHLARHDLAPTTYQDREGMLGESGSITAVLGHIRIDRLGKDTLLHWWNDEVLARGRSIKTGRNRLDAIASAFHVAVDTGLLDASPVEGFRAVLRRKTRTKKGRAQGDPGKDIHPIEHPEKIDALVAASEKRGGAAHVATMLQLEAGLRLGEATALEWSSIDWGDDGKPDTRRLHIVASRSRGKHLGRPKSGRPRRVQLSLRLRRALREHWLRCGRPEHGPVAPVDHANFRNRHFADVCAEAGIEATRQPDGKLRKPNPKDLRDTFASQHITAGVPLAWVSHQLGHADLAVTAKHYARWASGEHYRQPPALGEDEGLADLLARLGEKSHQSPTTAAKA